MNAMEVQQEKEDAARERRRRVKHFFRRLPGDAVKIAVIVLFAFPFYWMITSAFKGYYETIQVPPTLWPKNFTFENIKEILTGQDNLMHYLANSVIVTAAVLAIQVAVMVPAAYAFAIRNFPLKNLLFGIVLVSFMIPEQITYISVYLMFSKAKMINSLWPQILPFGANAFGIFLLRQSFRQIDGEVLEAARLDDAGEMKIMFKVALPMCRSILIAVIMFSAISIWNSYFWPLVMTNSDLYRPLTLFVEKLKQDTDCGLQWNLIMTGNLVLVLPILVIYCFASRQVIRAFTYNGVK